VNEPTIKASHWGVLSIAGVRLGCAVLDDEEFTRVLTERGITKALGGKRGGAHWRRLKGQDTGAYYMPVYLSAPQLTPFIDDNLRRALERPLFFAAPLGNFVGKGVPAELLPNICDVWLKARDSDALDDSQKHMAKAADILMRALAHVGIIALVDEATGFQEVRDRMALQAILEKFISKELLAWTKRFPDEFYQELFRLRNWQWRGMNVNRPSYVGHLTNDLVYGRLAPGVLEELRRITPRNDRGQTKHRFHQRLTEDVGHPALAQHLHAIIALMKAFPSWAAFHRAVQRAFPKVGETIPLNLEEN
jgi:hypothetical protein